jgi:alpha-L-rhamnosidase
MESMYNKIKLHIFIIILCVFITQMGFAQLSKIENTTCDGLESPINVDSKNPKFSWNLISETNNTNQVAYQIIVASNIDSILQNKGDIWDSKKVVSNKNLHITYRGKSLQSAKRYFWKVKLWDNHGNVIVQEYPQSFQTTLYAQKDWQGAKWIGYEEIADSAIIVPAAHQGGKKAWGKRLNILPVLRKNFFIEQEIKTATIFISGLGHFEMSLNGNVVSSGFRNDFLTPGWSQYNHHALYVAYNISDYIKSGSNAIGVQLGNGFYYIPSQRYRKLTGAFGLPKMICNIVIEYKDGTKQNIISDETWKAAPSPIIFSSIFGGEDYDANLEQKNWNTAQFNDSIWKNAIVVKEHNLKAQHIATKYFASKSNYTKTIKNDSIIIIDAIFNKAAIPWFQIKGNKGDTIKIIPGELIDSAGFVTQKHTGAPHFYSYIIKGDSLEDYHPKFSYYGFRYIQVELKRKNTSTIFPQLLDVIAFQLYYETTNVGFFDSELELYNKTYNLINAAIQSNMVTVFTDCPHREKLGWLEEAYLMGPSIQYNYNISNLLKKVFDDMEAAQTKEGLVPTIAPEYVQFDAPFRDSPEWGSASIILPWYYYLWYGDSSILRQTYPMMQKYFAYLQSKAKNNILTHGLSDWYDLGPNKPGFCQLSKQGVTATATFYYDAVLLQKIAAVLNKKSDFLFYKKTAENIYKSFNDTFWLPSKNIYGNGSQTELSMALYFNLVPIQLKAKVFSNLLRDIEKRNFTFTTGDIGFRYLLKILQQEKRNDIIHKMNNRDDVPGYGYQIKKGATALTESWQALPSVSNNHLMLGHLMEWFYEGVAGIKQSEKSIGYKDLIIEPFLNEEIGSANASFITPYGECISSWKFEDNQYTINVTIPSNTTATYIFPDGSNKKLNPGKFVFNYFVKNNRKGMRN